MASFNYRLLWILSQKEAIFDNMYHKEIEAELIKRLKLSTIAPKYIMLQLEEAMANPGLVSKNKDAHPYKNCKKFDRNKVKKLFFSVFSERVEIEGIKEQNRKSNSKRNQKMGRRL